MSIDLEGLVDPGSEAPAPAHDPHAAPDTKRPLLVFVALLCLTLVTVGISALHLPRPLAIALGLTVATVKAGLVLAVFMHALQERRALRVVLGLTAVILLLVLLLPLLTSPGGLANR
jgi:caa(3)-type oxidase subunit IV